MRYIPQYGEYYWTVFSDLTITRLRNNEREDDERRIAGGNTFISREAALEAAERVRELLLKL